MCITRAAARRLVTATIAVVAALPVSTAAADSLRIGTFNTRLVSPVFDKSLFDDLPDVARAGAIADAICTSSFRYDVLALNEVWDDDLREIVRRRVSAPECPNRLQHYVSFVNHPAAVDVEEDSGLMLFSRLPLDALGHPYAATRARRPGIVVRTSGDPSAVDFVRYPICSGIDCKATKGAALVRLRDPATGTHINVVFTHLNASDGDDDTRDEHRLRRGQLNEIVKLLDPDTVEARRDELYFLMGDLNINGDPTDHGDPTDPREEWLGSFDRATSRLARFPERSLVDTWDATTATDDLGRTSPSRNGRIDYILMSDSNQPERCVQHLQLDFAGLSDHLGVRADVNLAATHCSPRTARVVTAPAGVLDGALRHPGSMQWFRFDTGGTYSFALPPGSPLRYEVYEARDLTTPIAQFRGQTRREGQYLAETYHVPEGPVYVRVFEPDGATAGGSYRLFARRHACTSRIDACILAPNQMHTSTVSRVRPLNDEAKAWYQLATDRADSGRRQMLVFDAARTRGSGFLELQLLDATGGRVRTDATPPLRFRRRDAGENRYYLTVRRTRAAFGSIFPDFEVGWRTNLAVLFGSDVYPFELVAADETGSDWAGSDELRVETSVDGELVATQHFDDVDSDEHLLLRSPCEPLRFLSDVTIRVVEEGDGDNERSAVLRLDRTEYERPRAREVLRIADDGPNGEYHLNYNLVRQNVLKLCE